MIATGAQGATPSCPTGHRPSVGHVRLVSNHGPENDTIEQVLRDGAFLERAGLTATFVKVRRPAENLEAVTSGGADLCALSALNPLPDIVHGARARIVGAAMKRCALAVFSGQPQVRSVTDLRGRRIGVGPRHYVLHLAMLALLARHGIAADEVQFVEIGSNAQVMAAVAAGQADAGPSSLVASHDRERLGVHVLTGGQLWTELPDHVHQCMYAGLHTISQRREVIVQALSAFAQLFRFLQSGGSQDAFVLARRTAVPGGSQVAAEVAWRIIQDIRPYGTALTLGDRRIAEMQRRLVDLGVIDRTLPLSQIADMSMAREAMRSLRNNGSGVHCR